MGELTLMEYISVVITKQMTKLYQESGWTKCVENVHKVECRITEYGKPYGQTKLALNEDDENTQLA